MPPHSGQAPYGLLNENMRGDTSGKEMPQSAQARRSEKTMGSKLGRSCDPLCFVGSAVRRLCDPLDCLTGGTVPANCAGGRVPLPPDPPNREPVLPPSP